MSATVNSTKSPPIAEVPTYSRFTSESRIASAALSIRLTTRRLNCSAVDVDQRQTRSKTLPQFDLVKSSRKNRQRVLYDLVEVGRHRLRGR